MNRSTPLVAETKNPLQSYVQIKQHIADLAREAQRLASPAGQLHTADQAQEILVRLAEDRFNLAVVGQFKRGKSSLMNAIIGQDLLPTGLLPLTSAITTLCYGPQPKVLLRRKGWTLTQAVSLSELADYVTEPGNPGNEKGLIEARVELPVTFLRRGLHFVDTPGIGSARRENTETTYEFLPQADAVIFVTSVEAPLSEAEQNFLYDIRQHVHKLFVVLNKTDLLGQDERQQVLGYVEAGLQQILGEHSIRTYPLSARQALLAKQTSDDNLYSASGLPEFEADLVEFLAADKERVFLVAMLERTLQYIEAVGKSNPSERTEEQPAVAAAERLETIRQELETLHTLVLAGEVVGQDATNQPTRGVDTNALLQIKAKPAPTGPADRQNALAQNDTCPICDALNQNLFAYFAHLQYVLATQGEVQRAFAQAQGLCCLHTWHFQQIAAPQGISEGYVTLVEQTAATLRRLQVRQSADVADNLQSLFADGGACPACRMLQEAQSEQINRLLATLTTGEGRRQYVHSPGLCLPHLQALLRVNSSPEVADFLLQAVIQQLDDTVEDMRSYTLKRAALRRGLQNSDEKNAWRRALVTLVGEPVTCFTAIIKHKG